MQVIGIANIRLQEVRLHVFESVAVQQAVIDGPCQALSLWLEDLLLGHFLGRLGCGPVEVGRISHIEVRQLECRLRPPAVVVQVFLEKLVPLEDVCQVFDFNLWLCLLLIIRSGVRRFRFEHDECVLPGFALYVLDVMLELVEAFVRQGSALYNNHQGSVPAISEVVVIQAFRPAAAIHA